VSTTSPGELNAPQAAKGPDRTGWHRSVVSRLGRAAEFDGRTAGFVRARFSQWLCEVALPYAGLGRNDLAKALATDPSDVQSWPRRRVQGWLDGTTTVSVRGAFDVGDKSLLSACGLEVVFIAGHLAPFIGLLEYIADDLEGKSSLPSIAILPFVAYAPMFARSLDPMGSIEFKPYSDDALKLLRETAWPRKTFRRAMERFQAYESVAPLTSTYEKWPLEQAYMIARSTPSLDEAADVVLPYIAEWVASTVAWSDNLEDLVAVYEGFSIMRRAQRRRVNIPKENRSHERR
jgi:hypothetical protein